MFEHEIWQKKARKIILNTKGNLEFSASLANKSNLRTDDLL